MLFPARQASRSIIALTLLTVGVVGHLSAQVRMQALIRDTRFRLADSLEGLQAAGATRVDRSLFVLDRADRRVLVLDSLGGLHTFFGRHGSGPGEFQSTSVLGAFDSLVWVGDRMLRRLSIFRPTGQFIRTLTANELGALPMIPSKHGALGTLLRPVPGHPGLVAKRLVSFDSAGHVVDTVAELTTERRLEMTVGSRRLSGLQPFDDASLLASAQDELVVLDRTPFTGVGRASISITWYSSSGTKSKILKIAYSPIPLTDRIVETILREIAGRLQAKNGGLKSTAELYRPNFLPPVTDYIVSSHGDLWLRRERTGGEQAIWERYDLQGRLTKRVTLLADWWLLWADQTTLFAAHPEEGIARFLIP